MAMNLLMIGALPFGILRTDAIRDYANAAIPVCRREGLTQAEAAYRYVATRPMDSTALDFLKQADVTATKERAAKGMPKAAPPSGPPRGMSMDSDGNTRLTLPPAGGSPAAPQASLSFMDKMKGTLGPHAGLYMAGGAGLLLLLLFIPKKR